MPRRYGRQVAEPRFVALLRGINVGGRNKVAMASLRAAFEDAGYASVSTYIQSGNVLFGADEPAEGLEISLEDMLQRRLGMSLVVVVRTHGQLHAVVRDAPDGFGATPDLHHSDVVFLKASLSSTELLAQVPLRDGVDAAWAGTGVLYFQRLSARRSQSRMSALTALSAYQQMTIRSWSTTTRLLSLLDEPSGQPTGGGP